MSDQADPQILLDNLNALTVATQVTIRHNAYTDPVTGTKVNAGLKTGWVAARADTYTTIRNGPASGTTVGNVPDSAVYQVAGAGGWRNLGRT